MELACGAAECRKLISGIKYGCRADSVLQPFFISDYRVNVILLNKTFYLNIRIIHWKYLSFSAERM